MDASKVPIKVQAPQGLPHSLQPSHMAHSHHISARDIIAEIKGQSLVLPDLWQYMPADNWPVNLNPDLPRLREHVQERFQWMIERIPSKRRGLRKVEAQDLGRFGAGWWPYADYERMETCTDLCTWLFIWDDEIDEAEGEFNADYEHAQRCREDITDFVRELLDLPPYRTVNTSFRPILETSRDVWQRLCRDMTLHERRNLAKEIRIYLEMVGYEQGLRVDQSLPTLEEYWRLRMATSAVKITTAVLLYTCKVQLPEEVQDSKLLDDVYEAGNGVTSIMNDLLSVQKELAAGASSSNILFVLYAESGSLQGALERALDLLAQCSAEYETCTARLYRAYQDRPDILEALEKLVTGCRYMCTGNLAWSLATTRYGVATEHDGTITISL